MTERNANTHEPRPMTCGELYWAKGKFKWHDPEPVPGCNRLPGHSRKKGHSSTIDGPNWEKEAKTL